MHSSASGETANTSDSAGSMGTDQWEPFQMRFVPKSTLPDREKPRPRSRKNPFFSRTENDGSKLESVKEEEDPLRKCHLCDFASDCEEMHTEHLMSAHVFDLAL